MAKKEKIEPKKEIKEAQKKEEPEKVWTKKLEEKLMEQWDLVSLEELLKMFEPFTRKEVLAKHTELLIKKI